MSDLWKLAKNRAGNANFRRFGPAVENDARSVPEFKYREV